MNKGNGSLAKRRYRCRKCGWAKVRSELITTCPKCRAQI